MPDALKPAPTSQYARDNVAACPACGRWSTDAERRGGYGRGRAPALCVDCQREHPGERWCKRCEEFEKGNECQVVAKERRERQVRPGRYSDEKLKPCPACGTMSTDFERRGGMYGQGVAPRLCIGCQQAHPDERWCDGCSAFESTRRCPAALRERDVRLRDAGKYRSILEMTCPDCGRVGTPSELRPGSPGGSIRRCVSCQAALDAELVQCPSCSDWWPRGEYFEGMAQRADRVRSTKYTPCPGCRQGRAGERWCSRHKRYEPGAAFGGWATRSCREGAVRSRHHEDREALLAVHGTVEGQCMCCFRMARAAMVDHDHDCCPGGWSCGRCVRGLICSECNVLEGKIRVTYGPPYPRLIQEYLDRADVYRKSLPM